MPSSAHLRSAKPAELANVSPFDVEAYLGDSRLRTLEEIGRHVPADGSRSGGLYAAMMDYPLRPAKALRPALCLATCQALGGEPEAALPSAAAFELFHNAFLVHDDVEDGSLRRRHEDTLHRKLGVPMAVNVGDGMLALALEPLLDNVRVLGLGAALRIFKLFARLARESAEGQMLELQWIRQRRWDLLDRDYVRMVHKKTGWYSFIAPVQVGAVAAGAPPGTVASLGRFALCLGVAFQIRDDLLSLEGTESDVGKDAWGDLWEGKYTLPLLHALRTLADTERAEAVAILSRPRRPPRDRTRVRRLHALVTGRGGSSLEHAREVANRWAGKSVAALAGGLCQVGDSIHRRFLEELVGFVTERNR